MFDDPALTARGLVLRPARGEDAPFLRALFETARPDAAILAAWPEAVRKPFLDQQFHFQTIHYARVYPDADRLIVVADGAPVGRVIVAGQLHMRAGDVCEVEVDGLGVLSNPVVEDPTPIP